MRKLVFATNNKSKLKELNAIFAAACADEYQLLSLADIGFEKEIVEDADSFEGNAYKKAKTVCDFGSILAVADDSGLEVDALRGAPGVYSARYAGVGASDDMLISKLLANMADVPDGMRSARFTSVVCAVLPNGICHTERGECAGEILTDKKGDGGFGYDPVFYHAALGKTFAEMSEDEKNKISHRAIALKKLAAWLDTLPDEAFNS